MTPQRVAAPKSSSTGFIVGKPSQVEQTQQTGGQLVVDVLLAAHVGALAAVVGTSLCRMLFPFAACTLRPDNPRYHWYNYSHYRRPFLPIECHCYSPKLLRIRTLGLERRLTPKTELSSCTHCRPRHLQTGSTDSTYD
jgi:hypothetical protein